MLIMREREFPWTCGFRQMIDKYLYYHFKEKTWKVNDVIFFNSKNLEKGPFLGVSYKKKTLPKFFSKIGLCTVT